MKIFNYLYFMLMLSIMMLVSYKFIVILMIMENMKIWVLFYAYKNGLNSFVFILFMVYATIEATLGLMSLTRLWDFDSLVF